MLDEHTLGRAAIYPKFIDNASEIFDEEQLFELSRIRDRGGRVTEGYALSLASEILALGEHGVHEYGKRIAQQQNDAYRVRNERDPNPGSSYLGYFRFLAQSVNCIGMEHYDKCIRWFPEHDEVCHFQIEMHPKGTGTKNEKRDDRRKVVRAVARSARNFVPMADHEYDDNTSRYHRDLATQVSKLNSPR
ncbi:hypothetical protein [Oceaniovalibus sp. ACAM 378]|uniref:hypothetical protein n=1 Tax=Oceaniovalibus sp. ACAM 378 TaxID=2599923 RepID=UPI0011D39561|nr:hypothetical protein [Oceaniovalibus sp. ACAM 378]TYB89028.1 hypothetical protein FQ320_08865 [Oceaniovalibus sp. ACAM 378]